MPRFSTRLNWPFIPNHFSSLLDRKRSSGTDLVDLTCSNPTSVLPEYPHGLIASALAEIANLTYRPEPLGDLLARSVLAETYSRSHIAASPEQIWLTSSTSEAYTYLFELLCDPGDEVLTPSPSYPLFDHLASLASVVSVPYRLQYDGAWHIDLAHLRSHLTPRTRAIIVVNPNNPTGHYLNSIDSDSLVALAVEHDLALISDEVFLDYPLASCSGRSATLAKNGGCLTFCLGGLSKTAGMPQMKLAWTLTTGPNSMVREACGRLELIADTYLSVGTPVQSRLSRLLQIGDGIRQQLRQQIDTNVETLDRLLGCAPASRLHLEGGWSAIIRLPDAQIQEDWAALILDKANVIVQPGYLFDIGFSTAVVVSLITTNSEFERGIQRITDLLTTHQGA